MQGCVCPHPPLLIPAIGGDNRRRVQATVEAMERLAAEVAGADLVVVISPHTPGFSDAVAVRSPATLWGDFAAFRCPEVGVEIDNDVEFVDRLLDRAADADELDVEPLDDDRLDHGVLVPLFFLNALRLVNLSVARDYDASQDARAPGPRDRRRAAARRAVRGLRRSLAPPAAGSAGGLRPARRRVRRPGRRAASRAATSTVSAASTPTSSGGRGSAACARSSPWGRSWAPTRAPARVLSYEGPFGVGYAVAAFGAAA